MVLGVGFPAAAALGAADADVQTAAPASTKLSIVNGRWYINGQVTYRGAPAEGLLLNARMVNAVFEDDNEQTCPKGFDPEANTDAFIARIPDYVAHGVRAFTVGLQGGWCGYEGARPVPSTRTGRCERDTFGASSG